MASPELTVAQALLVDLRLAFEQKDTAKCASLLKQLKLKMISFKSCPPVPSQIVPEELFVARETLEIASFVSVLNENVNEFNRHFDQLLTYYHDFDSVISPSPRKQCLCGMYLLHLLSANRIGEFHMTLERTSKEDRDDPHVAYCLELERCLMDGNYSQLTTARSKHPHPLYAYFTDILLDTIRLKLSQCMEDSYETLPVDYAQKLLLLTSRQELVEFVNKREVVELAEGKVTKHWSLEGDTLHFKQAGENKKTVPAIELIHNTILYATELERIV